MDFLRYVLHSIKVARAPHFHVRFVNSLYMSEDVFSF